MHRYIYGVNYARWIVTKRHQILGSLTPDHASCHKKHFYLSTTHTYIYKYYIKPRTHAYYTPHHPLHICTHIRTAVRTNFYAVFLHFVPYNVQSNLHVYKVRDDAFMGPCIVTIFHYVSNKMQRYTLYYIWKLLYMFRVVPPPIIRSAYNCIYIRWYLSHRYCYLPL